MKPQITHRSRKIIKNKRDLESIVCTLDEFNDMSTTVSYCGPLYTRYNQILKDKNDKI